MDFLKSLTTSAISIVCSSFSASAPPLHFVMTVFLFVKSFFLLCWVLVQMPPSMGWAMMDEILLRDLSLSLLICSKSSNAPPPPFLYQMLLSIKSWFFDSIRTPLTYPSTTMVFQETLIHNSRTGTMSLSTPIMYIRSQDQGKPKHRLR